MRQRTPEICLLDIGREGFENASGSATASYGRSFRVIPEPGTAPLLALGLLGLASVPRRHRGRARASRYIPAA